MCEENGQSSEFRIYKVEGYDYRTVSSKQLEDKDCLYVLFEGKAYLKSEAYNWNIHFDYSKRIWFQTVNPNSNVYAYGFVNEETNGKGYFTIDSNSVIMEGGFYHCLNKEVAFSRGYSFCENCGWSPRGRECECSMVDNCEEYCFDYHSLKRKDMSNDSRFKIGIEVEKEDSYMMKYELAKDIYGKGWIKETDGSLNDETGFELISHTLNLYDCFNEIDKVKAYIDAGYSSNCGGHIHISDKEKSPRNLFNSIIGYLPLFYALYPNRINGTYSEAKPKDHYGSDHKSSFAIHSKTLEFRIFPSPKNTDVLKWRIELLRIIVENPIDKADKVQDFMLDIHSVLFKHLIKAYSITGFVRMYRRLLALSKKIDGETLQEKHIKDIELISQRVLTEV